MVRNRLSTSLLAVGLALWANACFDTAPISENCGNLVVETDRGEECDSAAANCGAPGAVSECRFVCDDDIECPPRLTCTRGRCRKRVPTFTEAADWLVPGGTEISFGDFDGDGVQDALRTGRQRSTIHYLDSNGDLSTLKFLAEGALTPPSIGRYNDDDLDDVVIPSVLTSTGTIGAELRLGHRERELLRTLAFSQVVQLPEGIIDVVAKSHYVSADVVPADYDLEKPLAPFGTTESFLFVPAPPPLDGSLVVFHFAVTAAGSTSGLDLIEGPYGSEILPPLVGDLRACRTDCATANPPCEVGDECLDDSMATEFSETDEVVLASRHRDNVTVFRSTLTPATPPDDPGSVDIDFVPLTNVTFPVPIGPGNNEVNATFLAQLNAVGSGATCEDPFLDIVAAIRAPDGTVTLFGAYNDGTGSFSSHPCGVPPGINSRFGPLDPAQPTFCASAFLDREGTRAEVDVLAIGDIDGDHKLDVSLPRGTYLSSRPQDDNSMDPNCYEPFGVELQFEASRAAAIADFNSDGWTDEVRAPRLSPDLVFKFTNAPNGVATTHRVLMGGPVTQLALGDYDANGATDVLAVADDDAAGSALQIVFGEPQAPPTLSPPLGRTENLLHLVSQPAAFPLDGATDVIATRLDVDAVSSVFIAGRVDRQLRSPFLAQAYPVGYVNFVEIGVPTHVPFSPIAFRVPSNETDSPEAPKTDQFGFAAITLTALLKPSDDNLCFDVDVPAPGNEGSRGVIIGAATVEGESLEQKFSAGITRAECIVGVNGVSVDGTSDHLLATRVGKPADESPQTFRTEFAVANVIYDLDIDPNLMPDMAPNPDPRNGDEWHWIALDDTLPIFSIDSRGRPGVPPILNRGEQCRIVDADGAITEVHVTAAFNSGADAAPGGRNSRLLGFGPDLLARMDAYSKREREDRGDGPTGADIWRLDLSGPEVILRGYACGNIDDDPSDELVFYEQTNGAYYVDVDRTGFGVPIPISLSLPQNAAASSLVDIVIQDVDGDNLTDLILYTLEESYLALGQAQTVGP